MHADALGSSSLLRLERGVRVEVDDRPELDAERRVYVAVNQRRLKFRQLLEGPTHG